MLSVLCSCTAIKAQNTSAVIQQYAAGYAPERAYIHYDKSNYAAGETIWFKVYLMKGLLPADESKSIYIDWINDKGTVMAHITAPLIKGISSGQFDVPADYAGRIIHVRAYTRWMLNFDTDFYYNKDINILSKEKTTVAGKVAVIPELSLFPEGGDAVAGIQNKIAFKANDQWGRPITITGTIINNNGETEGKLETVYDGMGYFYITPKSGLIYSVKWKAGDGEEHTTPLPNIKKLGIALQVTPMGNNRFFQLNFSPEIVRAIDSFHIVGTMYQHPVFSFARSAASYIKGNITTQKLPTGILTITVFDDHWNAVAERITYVNNQQYSFTPQIMVQQQSLNKRAKNEIQITVPDSITSNLSVSVTDLAIGAGNSSNIIAQLLLNGELKGEVYNSAHYFADTSAATQQDLDLVMLTHGWRRFNWDQVLKGRSPNFTYTRDTAYIGLSGIISGIPPGEINTTDSITLLVKPKDKDGQMLVTKILPDGRFSNPYSIVFDTTQLYFHLPEKKIKNISVQFVKNNLIAPPVKPGDDLKFSNEDTAGNYRHFFLTEGTGSNTPKGKLLQEVTVKSKAPKTTIQLLDEKYSSGLFSGKDGYQFDMVNDFAAKTSQSIFTYLQGRIPGLTVVEYINENAVQIVKLSWRPRMGFTPNNEDDDGPQLYLNEIRTSLEFIKDIPVNDLAYIKVLRPLWNGGGGDVHGAIAVYTKRGQTDDTTTIDNASPNLQIVGYTPIREFYSPDYESTDAPKLQPDMRTTLYWNPLVVTTAKQPAVTLSFFNNDVSKGFRVVVEGMTRNGKLAHVEQVIQ